MKSLTFSRSAHGMALLLALGMPFASHAEESLLWKSVNLLPASVVPVYPGSGSPFPKTAAPKVVSESDVVDEQAHVRDAAYANARNIFDNGKALQVDMRSVAVGGIVEGHLGPRVLINNQWLGVGGKLQVRQYKTQEMLDALKALDTIDPGAAQELGGSLNAKLAAKPTLDLTVGRITSQTLTLQGPFTSVTLKINANSE